jgi:hypothetical protein
MRHAEVFVAMASNYRLKNERVAFQNRAIAADQAPLPHHAYST